MTGILYLHATSPQYICSSICYSCRGWDSQPVASFLSSSITRRCTVYKQQKYIDTFYDEVPREFSIKSAQGEVSLSSGVGTDQYSSGLERAGGRESSDALTLAGVIMAASGPARPGPVRPPQPLPSFTTLSPSHCSTYTHTHTGTGLCNWGTVASILCKSSRAPEAPGTLRIVH